MSSSANKINPGLKKFLHKTNPSYEGFFNWWENRYMIYRPNGDDSKIYYFQEDGYISKIDLVAGYSTLEKYENNEQLNEEEKNILMCSQEFSDGTIIFINPIQNIYYANILFNNMMDREYEYATNNKSNVTITSEMRESFYKFCKDYSSYK